MARMAVSDQPVPFIARRILTYILLKVKNCDYKKMEADREFDILFRFLLVDPLVG